MLAASAICVAMFAHPSAAADRECSLPGGVANPEMARILAGDRMDRADELHMDFKVVVPRDKQRQAATRRLLDTGQLKTAADFCAAALVFQHGQASDDYLLAHILATVAVEKGDAGALWVAAATLDRFLMTTGRKQVFGTQFTLPEGPKSPWTQEPYDRDLITDALRAVYGVPRDEAQAKRLRALESDRLAAPR
jgi:hypothetical protein